MFAEHLAGPLDDLGGKPRQLGNFDPVASVCGASLDLSQKYEVEATSHSQRTADFLYPATAGPPTRSIQNSAWQTKSWRGCGRWMYSTAAQAIARPRRSKFRVRLRRAGPVSRGRRVQDRRRFRHFDHEGRAATSEVIAGADASEYAIHHIQPRASCRHKRSHLRQYHHEGGLPQNGRFAAHIRAGKNDDWCVPMFRKRSLGTNRSLMPANSGCSITRWRPPRTSRSPLSSNSGRQ